MENFMMTRLITGAAAVAICASLAFASTSAAAGPRHKRDVVRNPDGTVAYVVRPGNKAGKYYIRQHPYIMDNRAYWGTKFESPYSAFFGGNPDTGPTSW
jgi:hypothetical protein